MHEARPLWKTVSYSKSSCDDSDQVNTGGERGSRRVPALPTGRTQGCGGRTPAGLRCARGAESRHVHGCAADLRPSVGTSLWQHQPPPPRLFASVPCPSPLRSSRPRCRKACLIHLRGPVATRWVRARRRCSTNSCWVNPYDKSTTWIRPPVKISS